MYTQKSTFGDHTVYSYETQRYKLRELVEEMYGQSIETLQSSSVDFNTRETGTLQDIETDLHKTFYAFIKSNPKFKAVYCQMIRDIYDQFFPHEKALIYQSFPSIRFQFVGNKCVPKHYDSDNIGNHPLGERNFLLPITAMKGTTCLFLESEPGKGDFQGMTMDYGDLLFFNGNTCTHYNEVNVEGYMRISFDFRVLTLSDYMVYIMRDGVTQTNPRDASRTPVRMIVGGYYQCMFPEESVEQMMNWHFQTTTMQSRPVFDIEKDAVHAYMSTGDPFLTEFKETEKFEAKLKQVIGSEYCSATPSGTSALITALLACGVQSGDEVIVPAYTMVATVNAVRVLGAIPVIVDVSRETYTMELHSVRKAFTLKTKAVIHVSLNNRSIDLPELATFCKMNRLFLIEDAAQSLGCRLDGKHYGTFGDIGCFSFSTPKIITTGQGGCVVTNNTDLAAKIRTLKNFGRRESGGEVYESFGLNFKFTDIQAVIGISQLEKLEERVKRMREMFELYYSELHEFMLPPQSDEWIPWFNDILVKDRDLVGEFLKRHGVQTRVTYPALHDCANTNHISTYGLFLPTHFKLTNEEIRYICRLLRVVDLYSSQKVVCM
jgi:perosamine synthetase